MIKKKKNIEITKKKKKQIILIKILNIIIKSK
jgi:hypothetical protein